MAGKRRTFSGEFKAKVAFAALRGDKTLNEVASQFGLHPIQVSKWKKQLVEKAPLAMEDQRSSGGKPPPDQEKLVEELYRQIGRLKVERDWLEKKVGSIDRG